MTSNVTKLSIPKRSPKKLSKSEDYVRNNVFQLDEVQDNMVCNLKNAFIAARRGEIRAVVATYVKEDGGLTFICSGKFKNGEECIKVIGMLNYLEQDVRGVLKSFMTEADELPDENDSA